MKPFRLKEAIMSFEPKYENITFMRKGKPFQERVKIECNTEVGSESIVRILSISAKPTMFSVVNQENTINYQGKVNFFVCYEDQTGSIVKKECGKEFKGTIASNSLAQDVKVYIYPCVEKTEGEFSGVNLVVFANLLLDCELIETFKEPRFVQEDAIVSNSSETEVVKSYGVREATYPLQEEFEFNSVIQEVIYQQAQAVVCSCQCGVGSIIVDGQVYLSAIFLQSNEKRDIIRENKILPFKMEIDCEEAMPTMLVTARVWEKSIKTEIIVDESLSTSTVNCTVVLKFEGEAFATDSINVVTDAFSLTNETALTKQTCVYHKALESRCATATIDGRAQIDELPIGTTMLACFNERAEIASIDCKTDCISILGTLYMTVLFKDAEGKFFYRKAETSFNTNIDVNIAGASDCTVLCVANSAKAKMISATELELTTDLALSIYPYEQRELTIVKEIQLLEEKQVENSALSIYIPANKEELWSLSKRLNICPEDLLQANPELKFPLSGTERIVVFRKI